jgi:hypothetical protein
MVSTIQAQEKWFEGNRTNVRFCARTRTCGLRQCPSSSVASITQAAFDFTPLAAAERQARASGPLYDHCNEPAYQLIHREKCSAWPAHSSCAQEENVGIFKNSVQNMISNRGLYRFWLETQEGDITRLVSLWIDPLMKAFEPHDALRAAEITANPAPFSDDEPPPWRTLNADAMLVHAHGAKILQ